MGRSLMMAATARTRSPPTLERLGTSSIESKELGPKQGKGAADLLAPVAAG